MFDVCVIGSGAGGAPVAYTLSRLGFKVVVLEKGPKLSEADFSKDEIGVVRRNLYTPLLRDEQHVIETYEADAIRRYEGSSADWSFWNGSMLGGATNLMSGFFHRMKPVDFRLRSTFGAIEDAEVVDWPIDYAALEPYYDRVEKIVGVSGSVTPHHFAEPRSSPDFPYPPTQEHPASAWIDAACAQLGYRALRTPRAILSHAALGRLGCSYSDACGSFGCTTGAKGHAKTALLDRVACTILTRAFVYRLESEGAQVTRAHYFDADGVSHALEARIFVVAAGVLESVRLLLNSASKAFPNGLANNSGNVGKYLIFSAGGVGSGRLPLRRYGSALFERGTFVNRSLQDWYVLHDGDKTLKGGTIDFLFEHSNPIARAMGALYDDQGRLRMGAALDERLRYAFRASRLLKYEVFNDWLPTRHCYVGIDDRVRDRWGVRVGRLRLYAHPHDLVVARMLAQKAQKVLEALGCEEITSQMSPAPPPNLVAGGCRFGHDPQTSVLDPTCKAHELHNLFVSDASFMPTGGSVPYTFSIYANAFRVGDIIARRLGAIGLPTGHRVPEAQARSAGLS